MSALSTALVEDLGVSACDGAGRYIASDDHLTVAGKSVSVQARHAAVITSLINAIAGAGQIDSNGLDKATRPDVVTASADPFIVETITATTL